MAARLEVMRPDFFVTFNLDHHAWATPATAREMQSKQRSLLRWMDREGLIENYHWVNEAGPQAMLCTSCNLLRRSKRDDRAGCECRTPTLIPACVCDRSLSGCICGAGGENLHRHFAFRVTDSKRNRDGKAYFPWARLHEAANRLGLKVSDITPVFSHGALGHYMSKFARYLAKSFDSPLHAQGAEKVTGYRLKRWKTKRGFAGETVHTEWKQILDWPNHTRRFGFSQGLPPAPSATEWHYLSSPIRAVVGFLHGVDIADPITGAVPHFYELAPPS